MNSGLQWLDYGTSLWNFEQTLTQRVDNQMDFSAADKSFESTINPDRKTSIPDQMHHSLVPR